MKSGNYEELMNKFYAGTATSEERNLLQSEGVLNELESLYAQALKEERTKRMDWKFEEFMNVIPSANVIVLSNRRIGVKRIMAVAGVVVALLVTYIFWPQLPPKNEIAEVQGSHIKVVNKPPVIAKEALPPGEIKDLPPAAGKVKVLSSKNKRSAAANNRRNPVNKTLVPTPGANKEAKRDFRDYLVIVNGTPITNEAQALAITRESLALVSRNLTTTIEELKPIAEIKIKL